jgi:hypothetical protein
MLKVAFPSCNAWSFEANIDRLTDCVQHIRRARAANTMMACILQMITYRLARDLARVEARDVVGKLLLESGACVSHLRQRIWIPVDLS